MRLVAWVLLVQVINLSIDPMDPLSDKLGRITLENEDLTVNDIESFYELFSEQCLGIDVPEHDEDDENSFVKVMDFFFVQNSVDLRTDLRPNGQKFFSFELALLSVSEDLSSPPPRLA